MTTRWFWLGEREEVQAALEAAFGGPPAEGGVAEADDGDTIVVDAKAGPAAMARAGGRHAFAAVRWLKSLGRKVYVLVDEGDRPGPELARFCLANGVLRWLPAENRVDTEELREAVGAARRPSLDALLQRVERELADSGQAETTVQRLLRFEREHSPLQRLQDPETGLFDGPYATCKLDEEWKRSMRFHQPLSLLLLDLGPGFAELSEDDRRAALAEAASVFLNECRDIDVLSRFTPSTFLFLLPGTGTEGAEVLARRMLDSLRSRLSPALGLEPAAGIATVPSSLIPDRKAFLMVAESCLRRAQEQPGTGQVSTTWQ